VILIIVEVMIDSAKMQRGWFWKESFGGDSSIYLRGNIE